MKCHTHQEIDAIGLCSACHCGVCPKCETWIQGRLTCSKLECAEVIHRNEVIVGVNFRSIQQWKTNSSIVTRLIVIGALATIAAITLAIRGNNDSLAFVVGIFGVFSLFYGNMIRKRTSIVYPDSEAEQNSEP